MCDKKHWDNFRMSFWCFSIFQKTTEKFDKFLPKNMKGVEIIKIKTIPYTTTIYIWLYGLFMYSKTFLLWFDHFLDPWAEICQIFRWFFGKFKKSKRHSEIIWPLEGYITPIKKLAVNMIIHSLPKEEPS